jgi:fermentation-respiration switch protein FrsA (DUF1100 family)
VIHMKKKKLLPALFVSAASAWVIGTQSLFSLASRRRSLLYRIPRPRKKAPDAPPDELEAFVAAYQERIHAMKLKKITMRSRDGLTLAAHWYPAENACRTIVLVHGWRSAWDRDFAGITDYLHDGGANLLFIEQRAHGESEGAYIAFGLLERFDVEDWVKKLPEFSDPTLPVYLFGVSMGASTVLMASALPLPPSVQGIVADCGYTSPSAIIRNTVVRNTVLPAFAEKGAGLRMRLHTGFDYDAYSTLDAVRRSHIPMLFVHGDADTFVPVSMSYQNYAACCAPKSLLIVHGARHAMSYIVDPDAYRRKVEQLFSLYRKPEK